ncbi:dethiobiotin synthase [Acetobacter sp. TBRC 12305]|uniref:ATP-dependent dethiobiotin synthetase BioD n=1 Tax=Acetobacter garciniae TaxID=2817435 RepID=A0A939HMJ0_9PROT|nr:dethiobiotin synthase [Acetobacter garciniae]MBO1324082.1 dethiobiotin synthase [Acetobacter garciniae]MBX0343771.1 dethiobiotin synthase [Acetobacter garciniae]
MTPTPSTPRAALIGRSFDNAERYDTAAVVQRLSAGELAAEIAHALAAGAWPAHEAEHGPARILEIGCGTGLLTEQLHARWPQAEIVATDYSPRMVARARDRMAAFLPDRHRAMFHVMDATRPDVDGPFDVICGNMVLQWLENPAEVLQKLAVLLAPGGLLGVSTLLGGTFAQWRAACAAEGAQAATPTYPNAKTVAGWTPYPCSGAWRVARYEQVFPTGLDFLRHLKTTGAAVPREGGGRLSVGQIRRAADRLNAGGGAISWELAYGCFRRPPRQGVFVTGTDTGVGKTLISACLVQRWQALYWKPLQSGLAEDEGDTATVARLVPGAHCFPPAGAYQAPLSPQAAARAQAEQVDPARLALPLAEPHRPLVVEGAGGLMVPATDEMMMIDLAALWGLPVVLVARSGLGTLNHTLLSLGALRERGIAVAGVVLNGPANPENRRTIESLGKVRILAEIPWCEDVTPRTLAELAARLPSWEETFAPSWPGGRTGT